MAKFPESGDPEILPKPTITLPVGGLSRASPYSPNGTLLPNGPRWPAEMKAPDLAKFPQWKRRRGDEWTTLRERDMVKAWLTTMLREHKHDWYQWEVIEKFTAERSPLPLPKPYMVFRIFRLNKSTLELSIDFGRSDVDDADLFRERLRLARESLEVQALT